MARIKTLSIRRLKARYIACARADILGKFTSNPQAAEANEDRAARAVDELYRRGFSADQIDRLYEKAGGEFG